MLVGTFTVTVSVSSTRGAMKFVVSYLLLLLVVGILLVKSTEYHVTSDPGLPYCETHISGHSFLSLSLPGVRVCVSFLSMHCRVCIIPHFLSAESAKYERILAKTLFGDDE